MNATNEPIPNLVGEADGLALELLRRLDLLAGAYVHEGVSYSRYRVLSVIHSQGSISVGTLGRAMGLAQSTISEVVARLEKVGIVAKTRNVYDGRAVIVELSDRGRRLVEQYRRRVHERYLSLYRGLSPAERETFLGALKQLDELLRKGME